MAKEELLSVEGKIDEILPDGRFGVTLDNEHRIRAALGKTSQELGVRRE